MPTPLPFWTQRLPHDVRRRLDLAEAAAREARNETHARQAVELVHLVGHRMPFNEAVERYLEAMGVQGDEAEIVHTRALSLLDEEEIAEDDAERRQRRRARRWRLRDATPVGALRLIRRQIRENDREALLMEFVYARAEEALIDTHVAQAREWALLLEDEVNPAHAAALYVDRMELPEPRGRAVYRRLLAELSDDMLPRLAADDGPDGGGEGETEGEETPAAG